MSIKSSSSLRRLLMLSATGVLLAACGRAGGVGFTSSAAPSASALPPTLSSSPGGLQTATPTSTDRTATEPPGGTTSGDVPDNAVFLTYHGAGPVFSIQYVEGWQVTPRTDGVVIKDKDSSESVGIVGPRTDVAGYISGVDLPALQARPGFALINQDSVKIGSSTYQHVAYHQLSPADSVTGKQVPQTADRYYVPGPNGLAIVSLATPDGVDNVDAFRQMIASFSWSR